MNDRACRVSLERLVLGALLCSVPAVAVAQSAVVAVSHDDPDGMVVPGESIRVSVVNSRDAGPLQFTYLARVAGDLNVSPNAGVSSGWASAFLPTMGPVWSINIGTPSGAGRVGFELVFPNHPTFYIHFPGQWSLSQVELLSFDWTAPSVTSPTIFNFSWVPAVAQPDISIYNISQLQPYAIPTTYTFTSILVLPAPGVAVVLGGGWLCASRRRRSPR